MATTPRVLVLGEDTFPFHRFADAGPRIEAILDGAADVTLTTDREALLALPEYDVILDYLTDSTLTDAQRDALLAFVEGGGGYVGLHCASDLTSVAADDPDETLASRDEPWPALRDLVGGHFLTHPEKSEFGVRVVADHPVTAGVSEFSVYDEPYQVDVDDDVQVLARMDHPDLEDYPVAWTKPHGEGRVFYLSLGHTAEAFDVPEFGALLRAGVRWAAGAD